MKCFKLALSAILIFSLADFSFAKRGTGYKGGGSVVVDVPDDGGDTGGIPGDVEGPLSDKISDKGQLYGDLYKILRYHGGETKLVPRFDDDGNPVYEEVSWTDPSGNVSMVLHQVMDEAIAIGGEPVLTDNFVTHTIVAEDTGELVINEATGDIWFSAPTPSQCVQPLASFARWGDLSSPENLAAFPEYADIEFNKIPVTMSYDATWNRTEFAVGMVDRANFIEAGETWIDPKNGAVTYAEAVPWTDLIQEVHFGRLNGARAPEAVLQAAFDEAINSINAAVWISVDASGRILLTKDVYDEVEVDPATGAPVWLGTVEKAIDSPLENMALYLKLMRDGHLVTPGDERAPIDRSVRGGIPIFRMLQLEDGPSKGLRPTIDIQKLIDCGLEDLVDVDQVQTYYTYYEIVMEGDTVVDYVLHADITEPIGVEFETWVGIPTSDGSSPNGSDFEFCAATLAAAADKGGRITMDLVVYFNSILGLNKVIGMSEDGSIDFTRTPKFFDYSGSGMYDREAVFSTRGYYEYGDGDPWGDPSALVPGEVVVLQLPDSTGGDPVLGAWREYSVTITDIVEFRELGVGIDEFPTGQTATFDIGGFTQQADDNLSVIEFVHTFQIPENR